MKSLKIYFLDGTDMAANDRLIENYNDLLKWLSDNSDIPFIANRSDGKKAIVYKHAVRNVEVFRTV